MSCWRSGAVRLMTRASALVARGALEPLAIAGGWLPPPQPVAPRVKIQRDLPYHHDRRRAHCLDLYWPADASRPLPAVLYIHGGGFQMLSKRTHRLMAWPFVCREMLVANINYRLAPRYPFPAALIDCTRAWLWLLDHAATLGVDRTRLVVAGESAGANLALALSLTCCCRRDETWAAAVFERGVAPRVLLAYYGLLQTSDPERFRRRKPQLSGWLHRHLVDTSEQYRNVYPRLPAATLELADPLVVLERLGAPARPLPACLAAVGTRDPLLPDSRRLEQAYRRLGASCRARYYVGQRHGFNALVWTEAARRCWADTFDFLDQHLAK